MDNFHINIISEGKETLKHAVDIVLSQHSSAEAYSIENNVLIFYWTPNLYKNVVKLPYKYKSEDIVRMITGWLNEQDYGKEPDIDGDCEKGWRLYTEEWGAIKGKSGSMFAVGPAWAMYGK